MKIKIVSFVFLLLSSFVYSQTVLKGTVKNENNQPMQGVSVLNTDTNKEVFTNKEGNFQIEVSKNQLLVFSYPEYSDFDFLYDNQTTMGLNLIPKPKTKQLDEVTVVAIGYGKQKKELVSGAFSQLDSKLLNDNAPTDLGKALKGKVSGVTNCANIGSSRAASSIRIRGITTNGDNSPLIIMDGIPMGIDLSIIDPNNIESIDVIKDAATAIYGVRGANGVLLITTKSGKKNAKPKVSYNGFYGISEVTRKMDIMNASEYATYINEAEAAAGNAVPYNNPLSYGNGTNWQNHVFEKAPTFAHNFSVHGGSEKNIYSFGAGYTATDGVAGGNKSYMDRYNAFIKQKADISDRAVLGADVYYTNTKRQSISENGLASVIFNAVNMSPIITVYDGAGNYSLADGLGAEIVNPLAQIANTFNLTKVDRFDGQTFLEYKILPKLKTTSRFLFNLSTVQDRAFSPSVFYGDTKVLNVAADANSVYEASTKYFDYTFENFINYDFKINENHSFNSTLGTSIQAVKGKNISGTAWNVPYNSWDYATLGQVPLNTVNPEQTNSYTFESRMFSVFARLQYDFQNKYLFSGIIRRDASSKFGPEKRVGYFPSISAGWLVSKEDFFDYKFINFLKLRASWGITGNDKIDNNRYRGLLNGEGEYVFDNTLTQGIAIGALQNPEIHWEQNAQTNIGFDAKFWNNKIELNANYFYKKTIDLLTSATVSGALGTSAPGSYAPFINAGTIENKGFEIEVKYNDKITEDLTFSINTNLTTLKNKTLHVESYQPGGVFDLSTPTSRFETGKPIGYFFGYQTNGIFQNQAEIDAAPFQEGAQPGDLRFVDVNGDGKISFSDNTDQTMIGSPIPDVLAGLNIGLNYKDFDFAATATATLGNEVVRSYERFVPFANRPSFYLDRWTGEGTSTEVPRATNGVSTNTKFSDFYVEDGSFVRISNVQIGYNFPKSILDKIKISSIRFYIAVNNLYTFTKYSGFDPEVSVFYPTSAGIDRGQYPNTRTFLTGFNISF